MQFDLDFSAKFPVSAQIGMKRADDNANERWRHVFDGCVLAAARRKPEITSDDVLAEIEQLPDPPNTHNLAAIGPAMIRAEKMGILEHTDQYARSQRPEKNGNLHRVWKSRKFQCETKL